MARPRALDSLWSSMSPCSRPAPARASATNTILGVLTGCHLETTMLAPAVRRLPAGAAPALTCLPPAIEEPGPRGLRYERITGRLSGPSRSRSWWSMPRSGGRRQHAPRPETVPFFVFVSQATFAIRNPLILLARREFGDGIRHPRKTRPVHQKPRQNPERVWDPGNKRVTKTHISGFGWRNRIRRSAHDYAGG